MTIDTLQIYEQLRSSSLPDEAAKGIANVIKNVTESDLANKRDVAEILKEIENVRVELIQYIEQVRSELTLNIEQVRSELTQKIEQVRAELTRKIELGDMELRRDMERMRAGLLKWMAGMLVTQAVVIAAVVKLL
jgi:MinD-like ATPase involved in chromosome partitioning or flagellar assembly